jgi:hypothetical protein
MSQIIDATHKTRPLPRKMKHDASKTLDGWTKKQCETLEFCKLDIESTCNNLWVR